MNLQDTATSKLGNVLQRIADSASQCGRQAEKITLIAVAKGQSCQTMRALAEAGQKHFGENYLQEGLAHQSALDDLPLCWHFIGPLQSNKTREVAEHFAWVHSLDRLKIARRLDSQRPQSLPPLDVCLQVNISGEQSKSGVNPEELPALAAEITRLPRLRLRGLMAIPAPASSEDAQRAPCRQLREALESLNAAGHKLDVLSMGMSGDLEAAIAEGGTHVRVGTALFGPRR